MRVSSRWFALAAIAGLLAAQERSLRIEVIEGQGAINNITRGTAYEPVVQVLDEQGKPVPRAVVTFVLPTVGASGSFLDGGQVLSVQTDAEGKAAGRGLKPNRVAGPLEIRVTATHAGARGSTSILQTNAAPAAAQSKRSKKYLIAVLAAAAVAGGVAAASSGGGGTAARPPASDTPAGSITPGVPGFGPPQ